MVLVSTYQSNPEMSDSSKLKEKEFKREKITRCKIFNTWEIYHQQVTRLSSNGLYIPNTIPWTWI